MICEQCETVAHCTKHGCVPKQPAPVQEPEHIVRSNGRYSPLLTRMMNKRVESNVKQVIHLYDEPPAAQRQWVGLTEEEILKLAYPIRWQEVDDFEADKAVNFAQLVEAKLRSKNNG